MHMEGLWKSLQGVVNSAESRANPQRGETVCLRDLQQELSAEGFISCPQKVSSQNHSELDDNFHLDGFYLKFAAGSTLECFPTRVLHVERNSDTRSKTAIFASLVLLPNIACGQVTQRTHRCRGSGLDEQDSLGSQEEERIDQPRQDLVMTRIVLLAP